MTETGDMWREWNKEKKERNDRWLEKTIHKIPKRLKAFGIEFDVKNDGYHYICKKNGVVVDYWPTSGRWISRRDKTDRWGISELNSYLEGFKNLT